jgi:putative membrane protein insertion efficiency factor
MTFARRLMWNAGAPARLILIGAIGLYRLTLSGWLGGQCRFSPTCSRYAEEAVRAHGAIRGVLLASRRVLRCNPFGRGGLDPVPPLRRWGESYDDAIQKSASVSLADVNGRSHAG